MEARLVAGSDSLVEAQAAARAQGFARDSWIFLGIAAFITILRTYSRWSMVGLKRFQADDFLVWLALGLYAGENVIDTMLLGQFKGLANDFTDDADRATLDPASEEYHLRVVASKYRLAEWPMYAMLLWSLKAAMAVFYMRLTETLTGYRNRIYIFFVLMVTTFLIICMMPFITCRPIYKMWQINPDPGPLCYPESSPAILGTILGCNIVTDAYLLWLPMPMLFQASLPRSTKAVLICLFGCGLFVTVAATLRIALVTVEVHNFHAIGFWSVRETFVAIATTNMPAIFVLVRRWLRPYLPQQPQLTGGVATAPKASERQDNDKTVFGFLCRGDKPAVPSDGSLVIHMGAGPGRQTISSLKRSKTTSSATSQEYMLSEVATVQQEEAVVETEEGVKVVDRSDKGRTEVGLEVRRDKERDLERDAGSKPLPRLPEEAYKW